MRFRFPNLPCIPAQFQISRKFLVCNVFLGLISTACATAITIPTATVSQIPSPAPTHDVLFAALCRTEQGTLSESGADLFKNKQTGQGLKESCVPRGGWDY